MSQGIFHGIYHGRHGIEVDVLTDAKVKAARPRDKAYKLADANQLYLHVSPAGGKHWRMNYTFGRNASGRPQQKTLTFGPYPAVTLVDARRRRDDAKAMLIEGRDPATERRLAAHAKASESGNTFKAVAQAWFDKKKGTWAPRHATKVWESLEENVFGAVGALPITAIDAPRLLDLLTVVEKRGAVETAHRLRQRISAVFVYAIAAGIAASDPAASLGKALSPKPRARRQPALTDLDSMRTMLAACEAERSRAGTKLALRLLALTVVRPGELRHARWQEIESLDSEEPTWRIPAARMKGDEDRKAEIGGDHLVPLSKQAVAVLRALHPLSGNLDLMFPSERHLHKPISENTLRAMLIRSGYYQQHVPHGFRAAFSTIMNERADAAGRSGDRAIIDLMLAHVPKDKVESAYNRAAFMPRRRELAQEWADMLLDGFSEPQSFVGQPMRRSVGNPAG
jgi:integrase